MTDPDSLPDDVREFLDAERELDAPDSRARERLFASLGPLTLISSAASGTASGAHGAAHVAQAAGRTGLRAKILISAVSLSIGAAGGAATHAAFTRSEHPAAVSATTPMVTPTAPSAARPEPAPEMPAPEPATSETPVAAAPAAPSGSGRSSAPRRALQAERLLLERAQAALARGDRAAASAALREHARLYPQGQLAEERTALWRSLDNDSGATPHSDDSARKLPPATKPPASP